MPGRLVRQLGPGHTIVTVLCDCGTRYQSKLFNPDVLRSKNLPVPGCWSAGQHPGHVPRLKGSRQGGPAICSRSSNIASGAIMASVR